MMATISYLPGLGSRSAPMSTTSATVLHDRHDTGSPESERKHKLGATYPGTDGNHFHPNSESLQSFIAIISSVLLHASVTFSLSPSR
ncbi:hypothetical protein B9Z55_018509 [Caenorhabditis nigoni]|uniref:Uncharacterized protein n=1 Tax=Caenorhabditis nigoni TaxID=1611254 RepID=A0A2G5TEN2_9PELO|nr:hypothetical protein B9Z55_018509 [Caenorhabditis nigoni]